MLKLKMMLCVMMLPLVVVGLHIKASLSVSAMTTTASGVDNAASPDWQTPLNGIISPSESELCKNNWKEPKYINELEVRMQLPISMGNSCNYCEQYTRASGVINA